MRVCKGNVSIAPSPPLTCKSKAKQTMMPRDERFNDDDDAHADADDDGHGTG